jgi:hypothetical protein
MGQVSSAIQTVAELKTLIGPARGLLNAAKVFTYTLSFANIATGTCTVINTYTGLQAQKALMQLGGKIQKNIEEISNGVDALGNQQNQNKNFFPQHVHDLVSMCAEQQELERLPACIFVYTPGTDWHAAFRKLLKAEPLPTLCGIFDDVGIMASFLVAFREAVGPKRPIRILVPSVNVTFIPGELIIPPQLYPLQIEGELHHSGNPYVHVNIPNAPKDLLFRVFNVNATDGGKKAPDTWRKTLWSTSLATMAGGPAAVAGGIGGGMIGWMGTAVVMVVCPPLAPFAAAGAVATALGGAGVSGALAGKKVRKDVEKDWDVKYGGSPGTITGLHLMS